MTWYEDENGNRASLERWLTEAAARASLATLTRCSDCSDCSGCSGCSDCSDCSRCSDCSDCLRCSDCSDCLRCSGCSGCSGKTSKPSDIPPVPVIPDIHSAVLAACEEPGALNMQNFHTCATTHCRAGWVVHLAGEPGYALEKATDPVFAALQIYRASGYEISPRRFFDSDKQALADMRRLATSEGH